MKKTARVLLTVLFLVFLAAALASCGKTTGGEATATDALDTAPDTTAEATAPHEHVWVEGETTDLSLCVRETEYRCSGCGETKTETTETHVFGEAVRLITPPTAAESGILERLCSRCGKTGGNLTMTNAEYQARISALKAEINAFSTVTFGGAKITTDLTSAARAAAQADGRTFHPYDAPPVNPIAAHPRVLVNAGDLDGIRAALKDERNRAAAALFFDAVHDMS